MPRDRGPEQGDVDEAPRVQPGSGDGGSRNSSQFTRAASQRHLSWVEAAGGDCTRSLVPRKNKCELSAFEEHTGAGDPRHALQKCGGPAGV